jgi:hypothetical protein
MFHGVICGGGGNRNANTGGVLSSNDMVSCDFSSPIPAAQP